MDRTAAHRASVSVQQSVFYPTVVAFEKNHSLLLYSKREVFSRHVSAQEERAGRRFVLHIPVILSGDTHLPKQLWKTSVPSKYFCIFLYQQSNSLVTVYTVTVCKHTVVSISVQTMKNNCQRYDYKKCSTFLATLF